MPIILSRSLLESALKHYYKHYKTDIMDYLVHSQIKEKCRLAMPEGLKELMSDISREVLRAQPPDSDIYEFIASYLSALLVTRENLHVAAQVCANLCNCEPELMKELSAVGLSEQDAGIAQNVIMKYFKNQKDDVVQESNLLAILLEKTAIEADMFPAIINAVRSVYRAHQLQHNTENKNYLGDIRDEIAVATSHTLNLYRRTKPSEEDYNLMAVKIQASYRAYGVKREEQIKHYLRKPSVDVRSTASDSSFSDGIRNEMQMFTCFSKRRMNTASSLSLAGSCYNYPKSNTNNMNEEDYQIQLEETTERERAHIDYTARNPHLSLVPVHEEENKEAKNRKISFQHDVKRDTENEDEILARVDSNIETNYENQDLVDLTTEIEEELEYESSQEECSYLPLNIVESGVYEGDFNDEESENKSTFDYVNNMNKEVDTDSGEDQVSIEYEHYV